MKLYESWQQDYEQPGTHGYWYRRGQSAHRSPFLLVNCAGCHELCLVADAASAL
jgi:hypothetical protein